MSIFLRYLILILFASFHSVGCAVSQSAQVVPPAVYKSYVCYQAIGPIDVDGSGDEESWQQAAWTDYFVDIEGLSKPTPALRTRVKMLWDKNYFYFYAELEEPHIWGTLTERDDILFQDDDFEIFIDPDGDGQNYYEFELNALNTLWDLILLRPYRADPRPKVLNNWNIPNIKTAVTLHGTLNDPTDQDSVWTVEWAIPWDALDELANGQGSPAIGDQWRVNFSRVDWDMNIEDGSYKKMIDPTSGKKLPENNWVWNATGKINMHMPEQWGYVQFGGNLKNHKTDVFRVDTAIPIKERLWDLYFQQLNLKKTGKKYAEHISQLNGDKTFGNCNAAIVVYTSPYSFDISIASCNNSDVWIINSEGRIYKEE